MVFPNVLYKILPTPKKKLNILFMAVHAVVVIAHTVVVCVVGGPAKHGALKVVF